VIRNALVIAPAELGKGGLGQAAADFVDGLEHAGVGARFIGSERRRWFERVLSSRITRRAFGTGPVRRANAAAVRRSIPRGGWDMAYAMAGSAPVGRPRGVVVIHQSTHLPSIEFEALRRGEAETGGWGDMSGPERRRREHELERADLVHVTTKLVRDEFLAAGFSQDRLVLAPLGVDLARFEAAPKPSELGIAFIGPLSMRKGVDAVAELASRMADDATVLTVGGPTCPWSRRVVESARFRRCGSAEEVLARAQVLVLPSRADAFAYVVLEALATGTVPIVTPEVGASEIVRRLDPRLVRPLDGFAEGVQALLPGLDLPELSRRARQLGERYDRRRTTVDAASMVLAAAGRLR
jgi:glycosyltransferase involved in cell wall biosynthesis